MRRCSPRAPCKTREKNLNGGAEVVPGAGGDELAGAVRKERRGVQHDLEDGERHHVSERGYHRAAGSSLHAVADALEKDGVEVPGGGARWSRATIRYIVLDDVYRPHSFDEVTLLVGWTPKASTVSRGGASARLP